MDPLDQSQEMEPVEFKGIPTPEELDRDILKIWKICIIGSLIPPAVAVIVVLAILLGYTKMSTVGVIAYPVTALILITFGLCFVIPAGITSIKRMSMTVRMAYTGLHTNEKVARKLEKFVTEAHPIAAEIKSKLDDGLLQKIEGHLKRIADRVQKETDPLQPKKRTLIED